MNSGLANYSNLHLIGRGIQLSFNAHFSATRIEQKVDTGEHLVFAFYPKEGLRNVALTKLADGEWSLLNEDRLANSASAFIDIKEAEITDRWCILDDTAKVSIVWPKRFVFGSTLSGAKWRFELLSKDDNEKSIIFCRGPFHPSATPGPKQMVGAGQEVVATERMPWGFILELKYDYEGVAWRQFHMAKQLSSPDGRIFIITGQGPESSRDTIKEVCLEVTESLAGSPIEPSTGPDVKKSGD